MDGRRPSSSSQGSRMLSNCSVKKMYRDGALYYVDLCFHASSLHCLHTFWHAIPTSFYIFYFLVQHEIPLICKISIRNAT